MLSPSKVQTWFQNRRAAEKRKQANSQSSQLTQAIASVEAQNATRRAENGALLRYVVGRCAAERDEAVRRGAAHGVTPAVAEVRVLGAGSKKRNRPLGGS